MPIDGPGSKPPSGATPPTPPTGKTSGDMGDKSVTKTSGTGIVQNSSTGSRPEKTSILSRKASVVHSGSIPEEALKQTLSLFKNQQWKGAESAVARSVNSLEQHQQLRAALGDSLPIEGQTILANRYGTLRAEQAASILGNIEGTPTEQRESINFYFIKPDSHENAVSTIARVAADEFLAETGFDSSLKTDLIKTIKTETFKQLEKQTQKLGLQVAREGDSSIQEKLGQQDRERMLDLQSILAGG